MTTEFLAGTFKAIGTVEVDGGTVEVGHAQKIIHKLVGHKAGKIVTVEAVRGADGVLAVRRGIAQTAIKAL